MRLCSISIFGYAINNIFPARIGEIVRPLYLSKKENIPISTSFGSVIIERALDSLGFAFLGILPLVFFSNEMLSNSISGNISFLKHLSIRNVSLFCLVIFFSGALVFFVVALNASAVKHFSKYVLSKISKSLMLKADDFLNNFFIVFDSIKKMSLFVPIVGYTFVIIALYASGFWVLCRIYEPSFYWVSAAYTISVLAFGVAIPSAPGYIGVMQLAVQKGLEFFNYPSGNSEAVAIIYWACGYIPITLLGIYIYFKDQITLKAIKGDIKKSK